MSRLERSIQACREAIATASEIPIDKISALDDIQDDLGMSPLEQLSLALIIEEIFSISCPESTFEKPIYRNAAGLAEWCIRRSEEAAWRESQRQRRLA